MQPPLPRHCSACFVIWCVAFLTVVVTQFVVANPGATVPWITYEAEQMIVVGGAILSPPPPASNKNVQVTNTISGEASGRSCVRLAAPGDYVQFTAGAAANAMVLRYCVPDSPDGSGLDYTLSLYTNGVFSRRISVTSKYSWFYGYPPQWNPDPGQGNPRNYYDEAHVKDLAINPGDSVRLQIDPGDVAAYYVIDLVDLEQIAPPLAQPPGSVSILSYGAAGNGVTDDTTAIRSAVAGGGTIWFPAGNYLVTGNIAIPANTTIQGAGMWHTTFVGSHASYVNENGRVRFNGAGSNIRFADFAILGRLTMRQDYMANDGFSEFFGTNSSIERVWVEHTKTGAWIANSLGMVIRDCRFRNTVADGINLSKNCNSCIVTNCTARGTGDDSFAIWPAEYVGGGTNGYTAGFNVITHCTAQMPWFANGCGIYGAISNRVEDSFFQDIPNGAGILIAGTFPIGTNLFRGTTVAQRCDLNRAGGYDPGWQWRGALTVCPQSINITGLQLSEINISNSLSYAVQFVSPGGGVVSNASMSSINVRNYGLGVPPFHPQDPYPFHTNYLDGVFGVFARNDAKGGISVSDLSVNGTDILAVQTNAYLTDCVNQSNGQFAFTFLTQPITVTVQANPSGHTFIVDGVTYTNTQVFNWMQGASHLLGVASPQNASGSMRDVWVSWSDGGAQTHSVAPMSNMSFTANFTTQLFLTANASAGGSVNPTSGWFNSNVVVNLTGTPSNGFSFAGWSGALSGTNNPAVITITSPLAVTANFTSSQVASLAFIQQPVNVPQGATLIPAVQVRASDTNSQPLAGASISVALASGAGSINGTLSRVTDANGLALFDNLSFSQAGPKTLVATALTGTAVPTNSSAFMVIGSATTLAFTQSPSGAVAGITFAQQPMLQTVDAFGSPSAAGLPASLSVTVTASNGPGALSGALTHNLGSSGSNGIVVFNNLAIDLPGSSYQLVATTGTQPTNPVPGAVLWLDANDAASLTTNGTRVQGWKNKGSGGGATGTNLWFTQNTTALRPWLTNDLNGRPLVTFSKNGAGYGAGCTYLGNIGLGAFTNGTSQMTVFVLARQRDGSFPWQSPVSFSAGGQIDGKGTAGVVVLLDGSQAAPYPFGIQRNRTTTPMQANVAAAPVSTPFVLTFVDNAGSADLFLRESSGVARTNSANTINGISPYKYAITDVTIGARLEPSPGPVDNGWDGDVAEVLVYNSALSAVDRTAVETYLTNKWFTPNGGLTLGSAVSAPFAVALAATPPRQSILSIVVNSNATVTLTYATTPGFAYRVETSTNLTTWFSIPGSATNSSGGTVLFTDLNPVTGSSRYYRTASP